MIAYWHTIAATICGFLSRQIARQKSKARGDFPAMKAQLGNESAVTSSGSDASDHAVAETVTLRAVLCMEPDEDRSN
jgi:hypothetical protein